MTKTLPAYLIQPLVQKPLHLPSFQAQTYIQLVEHLRLIVLLVLTSGCKVPILLPGLEQSLLDVVPHGPEIQGLNRKCNYYQYTL